MQNIEQIIQTWLCILHQNQQSYDLYRVRGIHNTINKKAITTFAYGRLALNARESTTYTMTQDYTTFALTKATQTTKNKKNIPQRVTQLTAYQLFIDLFIKTWLNTIQQIIFQKKVTKYKIWAYSIRQENII